MTTGHPNAAAAGGSTIPAVLIVWLAGYFGLDLSAEAGALVAGGIIATALFVGRRGIVGVARIVWRGNPPSV